jgi:hypothetical protein
MKAAAITVGIVSCTVSLLALAVGLLYLATSMKLGLLLLGVGVACMEGGVHLIRSSNDPKVLAVSSSAVSGTIALLALGFAAYAANLGAERAPEEEPVWLPWALYAAAGLCAWIGLRAGWHAISGSRKGRSA